MLLLCRAEILSTYNNRRNTVKATLKISGGQISDAN
jgi:hypothetical protein